MPEAATPTELDQAHQRALAMLVDIGTSLAIECKTPTQSAPLHTRTLAFARVAEAIRRTILLSQHIAHRATQAAQTAAAEAAAAKSKRDTARKQVIRAVEDTIERDAHPADAQALRRELLERIDAPEFADDLAQRTPAQLIAELCRDMALANLPGNNPAPRRTPEAIARLCAQAAAAPGAGLAQWAPLPSTPSQPKPRDPAPPPDDMSLHEYLLTKHLRPNLRQ